MPIYRKLTAYVGLGSNLPSPSGGPLATLLAATDRLQAVGAITAKSSFYETEPVGFQNQPRFLNAVIAIESYQAPEDLLDQLLTIEREFGRERSRTPLKGPRTLDLDLLLMGNMVLNGPRLTLPHPSIAARRFVLAPLAEIAPEVLHPVLAKTIATLLAELRDEGENRIRAVNIL